jgi:hypothetical protein
MSPCAVCNENVTIHNATIILPQFINTTISNATIVTPRYEMSTHSMTKDKILTEKCRINIKFLYIEYLWSRRISFLYIGLNVLIFIGLARVLCLDVVLSDVGEGASQRDI